MSKASFKLIKPNKVVLYYIWRSALHSRESLSNSKYLTTKLHLYELVLNTKYNSSSCEHWFYVVQKPTNPYRLWCISIKLCLINVSTLVLSQGHNKVIPKNSEVPCEIYVSILKFWCFSCNQGSKVRGKTSEVKLCRRSHWWRHISGSCCTSCVHYPFPCFIACCSLLVLRSSIRKVTQSDSTEKYLDMV